MVHLRADTAPYLRRKYCATKIRIGRDSRRKPFETCQPCLLVVSQLLLEASHFRPSFLSPSVYLNDGRPFCAPEPICPQNKKSCCFAETSSTPRGFHPMAKTPTACWNDRPLQRISPLRLLAYYGLNAPGIDLPYDGHL